MNEDYWLRQAKDKPLFEDLLWSRPENQRYAGKLLIVGGNTHSFAAPAAAFNASAAAGIGTSRVFLPEPLKKLLGKSFAEAEFGPATPSGSFSRQALSQLLELADWADGILLAGDFGRNSETAILLESLLNKYNGQITVAHDALDYLLGTSSPLITRPQTAAVINLGKLQKLARGNRPATPILHNMMLQELVQSLHDWTTGNPGQIVTRHAEHFMAASGGQVSTTPSPEQSNWQVELPAYASVWWLQNPEKRFEALTSAVYEYLASRL